MAPGPTCSLLKARQCAAGDGRRQHRVREFHARSLMAGGRGVRQQKSEPRPGGAVTKRAVRSSGCKIRCPTPGPGSFRPPLFGGLTGCVCVCCCCGSWSHGRRQEAMRTRPRPATQATAAAEWPGVARYSLAKGQCTGHSVRLGGLCNPTPTRQDHGCLFCFVLCDVVGCYRTTAGNKPRWP